MTRRRLTGGIVAPAALAGALPSLAGNAAAVLTGWAPFPAPVYLTWALTERCPLRCRHCDMGRPTRELPRDARLALAERIGRSRLWGVSLIGGEPSLVPELAELASTLERHRKYVTVGTSGRGLGRHLPALLGAGVDALVFSVDSHRAEDHDAFRGRAGLFEEVSAHIERVRAQRGRRPRVQVRCTIHRDNFRDLPAILEHWEARADHVILQLIQDNGIHHVRDARVLFRPEDRGPLEQVLAELARARPALRTRYHALMARYVFDPTALREELGYRCLVVPGASMVLMPDGRVRLCYGREDSDVGDLMAEELDAVWQRAATRLTRRRMQSRSYGCMCWEAVCSPNMDLLPWVGRAERLLGRQ